MDSTDGTFTLPQESRQKKKKKTQDKALVRRAIERLILSQTPASNEQKEPSRYQTPEANATSQPKTPSSDLDAQNADLWKKIYLNHKGSLDALDATLNTITMTMANCEFYTSIYAGTLEVSLRSPEITVSLGERLKLAFPEFYAAALVFSIKAKGYFAPSVAERFTNPPVPFANALQKYINEITEKERLLKGAGPLV
ncbi:hypothetical protein BDD12DRAFT_873058 [Trichophaea hybrida]|nr:hypothetical protein BDD12DRAFT_873058 [Trichophaea hybrida]